MGWVESSQRNPLGGEVSMWQPRYWKAETGRVSTVDKGGDETRE